MKTITFTCETITPMFLSGADGKTPELRPPSIKGALRFWWRAMNGHLPLKELKEKEGDIFGDTSKRSLVIIRCQFQALQTETNLPVPHKDFMKQKSFAVGQTFSVTLGLTRESKNFGLEELSAVFEVACILGGLGKRVRRGMGSVQVIDSKKGDSLIRKYPKVTLGYLEQRMKLLSPYFILEKGKILNTYNRRTEPYPWIKSIETGNSQATQSLLFGISKTTHELKENNHQAYEASLGHASRGRFASPVFVSVLLGDKGKSTPIITTLNAVPDHSKHKVSKELQEKFSQKILKKEPNQ